jgi:DNA repair protein RecO (recombination protein O)
MLYKTSGIAIHQVKYSESSVIAKIYTRQFGLLSFLVRGSGKKKNGIKPALLQHLSLTDMVISYKEKNNLHYIEEITAVYPFRSLPYDIRKSSVAIFINEVLYRSIREEEANENLFDFLYQTIVALDSQPETGMFHLGFLINLSRHLGFFPKKSDSNENDFFYLQEGTFSNVQNPQYIGIRKPFSTYLAGLIEWSNGNEVTLNITKEQRNELLSILLKYYQVHVPGFGELKSHHVLHEVLSD